MKRIIPILFLLVTNKLISQTQIPGFFTDSMVLQQQTDAVFWGTDKANTKLVVKGSWGKSSKVITDQNGYWKLKISTPVAGGPYTIWIKGTNTIVLHNVLIGEVWFCSGQSNMEMPVKGNLNQPVIGSNDAILQSNNTSIRFFYTTHSASLTPLNNVKGNWKQASSETTGNFSATAYFFAKKINALLGVPVGIIQSAWGASTIESWMDPQSLSGFNTKPIPELSKIAEPNKTPTILYNSMLHPYIGFTFKGVLWYQGEANRENASDYHAMFSSMIKLWRAQWQQGDFPFYFVQIAPFEGGKANAAYLREAQLKTMLTEKNTGMVVTLDIGEKNVIHPSQKETVGNRLAYWALANEYGYKGVTYSGPIYREMKVTNNGKIEISFDYSNSGLTSFGKTLDHFEIAGEDKIFYPANAVIVKDKKGSILVWNDEVKIPVSVRYAFKSWAEASLFNIQGLPASSFRTDSW